jgi:hypothetical protein
VAEKNGVSGLLLLFSMGMCGVSGRPGDLNGSSDQSSKDILEISSARSSYARADSMIRDAFPRPVRAAFLLIRLLACLLDCYAGSSGYFLF